MVPDMSMAHSAQLLLDACLAVGLVEWSIALALALENTLILSGAAHLTCASTASSEESVDSLSSCPTRITCLPQSRRQLQLGMASA